MTPVTLDFLIHLVAMNLGFIAEDSKVDLKNCGIWQHQQSPETVTHPSLFYGAPRTYIQELRGFTSSCGCALAPGGKSE